eukprot:121186-Rhodomonas_salina.1
MRAPAQIWRPSVPSKETTNSYAPASTAMPSNARVFAAVSARIWCSFCRSTLSFTLDVGSVTTLPGTHNRCFSTA